jgi:hypothetical protein
LGVEREATTTTIVAVAVASSSSSTIEAAAALSSSSSSTKSFIIALFKKKNLVEDNDDNLKKKKKKNSLLLFFLFVTSSTIAGAICFCFYYIKLHIFIYLQQIYFLKNLLQQIFIWILLKYCIQENCEHDENLKAFWAALILRAPSAFLSATKKICLLQL